MDIDYFKEETQDTKMLFDLDEMLDFQLKHDIQIIRGADYQYMCYINKQAYFSALTPLGALVYGITKFKETN